MAMRRRRRCGRCSDYFFMSETDYKQWALVWHMVKAACHKCRAKHLQELRREERAELRRRRPCSQCGGVRTFEVIDHDFSECKSCIYADGVKPRQNHSIPFKFRTLYPDLALEIQDELWMRPKFGMFWKVQRELFALKDDLKQHNKR